MICRAFYKISRFSCIMSFEIVDLQLWLKYLAAIQIPVFTEMCWYLCEPR
jgi:hypothetical protein